MIKIFISHSWATDSSSYELFCKILDDMPHFSWENLSISRDKPYYVWKEGKLAWEARKEILEKRLPLLQANLKEAKNRTISLGLQLDELERSQIYGNNYQDVERWLTEKVSLLEGTVGSILERREELRMRVEKIIYAFKSGRIQYLLEHQEDYISEQKVLFSLIERLQSEIFHTEKDLISFSGSFEDWVIKRSYNYYQDLFYEEWEGKTIRRVKRFPKDLMGVISNNIIEADVFVTIAGQFSYYKQWLEYELKIAKDFRKPIVLLLPLNYPEIPKELRHVQYKLLPWDNIIIQIAMKEYDVIKSRNIASNENED